jgi:lipopolysaccharide transport system ATP-binding protein
MASVKALCNRGIVLQHGTVAFSGEIDDCVSFYLGQKDIFLKANGFSEWPLNDAPGCDEFKLVGVSIMDCSNNIKSSFSNNEIIRINVRSKLLADLRNMRLNFSITNRDQLVIFTSSSHKFEDVQKSAGEYIYEIRIPPFLFNHGEYFINLQAGIPGERELLEKTKILSFSIDKITDSGTTYSTVLPGVVAPELEWSIKKNKK